MRRLLMLLSCSLIVGTVTVAQTRPAEEAGGGADAGAGGGAGGAAADGGERAVEAALSKTFLVRRQMYMDHLKQEGFDVQLTAPNGLAFMFDGYSYLLIVDEEDPGYFEVAFPNLWAIRNEEERLKALSAAEYASKNTKVGKVHLSRDRTNVHAVVQLYFAEPADFKPVFERSLYTVRAAAVAFARKMREE